MAFLTTTRLNLHFQTQEFGHTGLFILANYTFVPCAR